MPSHYRISVIMSVYNGGTYLREAIESILNQTFTDFEFIIVNDASTDNSLETIQGYQDERISLINNEANIGLTKALNKAMIQARGEFLARQDADDISLPNRFEEQIKYLGKYPEVGLLGTSIYEIDESGNVIGKNIALAKPGIKDLLKSNKFSHGSVMFRNNIIDKLGGYNELLKSSQDHELWLRIAYHYEVRNLPGIFYKLRSHSNKVGVSTARRELALHRVLSRKLARNELDQEALKEIRDRGIESLYSFLSKREKAFVYQTVAGLCEVNGDKKRAKENYKKAVGLSPFDIVNNVNLVRSHLEGILRIDSAAIRGNIRNFLRRLQNLLFH